MLFRSLAAHDVVAVGARSAGPVASLLPALRDVCDAAVVPFHKVGTGEFAGMCGGFYDAAMTGAMRHRDDPLLTSALVAARRRKVVEGWSWERLDVDVDAAPLVAVTGAHALYLQHRGAAADYDAALSVY